jgi:large subunit ribosomal protein L23
MNISHVILGPVISEKSMKTFEEKGQHFLYVHADATKADIKSAIKNFFDVNVRKVQIIKLPTKTRVRGKHGPQIKRKRRKKAILSLRGGESFDLLKLAPQKKVSKKKKVEKVEGDSEKFVKK